MRKLLFVALCLLPSLVFAQTADLEIVSAVDAPDPVAPGATLTYTVTLTNHGPDAAPGGGVNINLPLAVTHQSSSGPAGFTCQYVGNFGTCNMPSLPVGTYVVTVNATVNVSLASFADQDISASFSPSGTAVDLVPGNNTKSATTRVDSPQVDLSLTATDSPDPVFPDGNVTYSGTLTNGGPDTASSVNFNVVPNSNLRFVSASVPGWNCTLPSVGAVNATFTCSRATWAPGTDNFTVVFSANDEQFGINDTSFNTYFSVFAGASNETDTGDNDQTVTTQYVTPDADVSVTVTDSPDPVFPDGNITYTVTVANAGPDTAPNITLSSFGSNNLRFVSATVPAGWNCSLPAANAQTPGFSCTLPAGLASGTNSVLTFVLQATDEIIGINDTTIQFGFSAHSTVSDPDPPGMSDNAETESTAYVTPDADMNLTASDSPDPVVPDGDITYTVTVTNQGPDAAPDARMTVVGNGGQTRFQSITAPAGWTCSMPAPGTLLNVANYDCTIPSLASGASAVFTIVTEASDDLHPNTDHNITQAFTTGSSVADPDGTDNSTTVTTAYDVSNANLGVTAADAPDPVAAGSNITYTGTVTSAGPDTAQNVTFTIPLSPSLLFQSIVGPAGFSCTTPAVGANGTITCTIASLANGANLPFTVVAQVNPSLNNGPDGIIQQDFLISSATSDPVNTNNSLRVDTQYTTPDADISTTNSASPDPVAPGGTITFTQSITNNGPDTAVNATFNQSVPSGTTFQSLAAPAGWTCTTPAVGATGAINCSKASMTSGETGNFTLVVNVTASSGSMGSTVTGDSDTYDPDPADNSAGAGTTVIAPTNADLAITKSTTTTNAPAGSTFAYTIVVTNNGPDTANDVVMTDVLPSSLLFRSITEPTGFDCTTPAVGASGTITCTAATLANGASRTFTLTVEVAQGASGSIVNGATVGGSNNSDSNGGNSSGSASGVVAEPPQADVAITKTTPSASATPGNQIVYTITVSNAGPSPATNVVVTDVLPAGVSFVSATPSQGTCNGTSTVTCNLGTLANGANATITLRVQVTASSGTITNTASVSSTEGGGDSATTAPIPVVAVAAVEPIPTMSEWALIALAMMLAAVAAKSLSS